MLQKLKKRTRKEMWIDAFSVNSVFIVSTAVILEIRGITFFSDHESVSLWWFLIPSVLSYLMLRWFDSGERRNEC